MRNRRNQFYKRGSPQDYYHYASLAALKQAKMDIFCFHGPDR